MGKVKDKKSIIKEFSTPNRTEFEIYVDSSGVVHLPLDFPDKEEVINSLEFEDISELLKKSGGYCG